MFYKSLCEKVKDELAAKELPKELSKHIDMTIVLIVTLLKEKEIVLTSTDRLLHPPHVLLSLNPCHNENLIRRDLL